jgi:hypothetical protein
MPWQCLFATHGHDLRPMLRTGATDEQLAERLRSIWTPRADRYSEARTADTTPTQKIEMSYIGGWRSWPQRRCQRSGVREQSEGLVDRESDHVCGGERFGV